MVGLFVVSGVLLGGLFAAVWLLWRIMRPLAVASSHPKWQAHEKQLTFCALAASLLPFAILPVYVFVVWKHWRDRTNATNPQRWLPRVALSELMAIVLSVAVCPLWSQMYTGHVTDQMLVSAMMTALLLFPALFLAAYYRLDSNGVPLNFWRLLFLFVYPYAATACFTGLYGALLLLFGRGEGALILICSAIEIAIGRYAAVRAARTVAAPQTVIEKPADTASPGMLTSRSPAAQLQK